MSFGLLGSAIAAAMAIGFAATIASLHLRERRRERVFDAEFASMRTEMRGLEARADARHDEAASGPAGERAIDVRSASLSPRLRAALAGR
jgi:hypothetical protein